WKMPPSNWSTLSCDWKPADLFVSRYATAQPVARIRPDRIRPRLRNPGDAYHLNLDYHGHHSTYGHLGRSHRDGFGPPGTRRVRSAEHLLRKDLSHHCAHRRDPRRVTVRARSRHGRLDGGRHLDHGDHVRP